MQQDIGKTIADLHMADTLTTIDFILALHDAKIIDKSIIAERWLKLAERDDLEMNDVVRKLIKLQAQGLQASGSE